MGAAARVPGIAVRRLVQLPGHDPGDQGALHPLDDHHRALRAVLRGRGVQQQRRGRDPRAGDHRPARRDDLSHLRPRAARDRDRDLPDLGDERRARRHPARPGVWRDHAASASVLAPAARARRAGVAGPIAGLSYELEDPARRSKSGADCARESSTAASATRIRSQNITIRAPTRIAVVRAARRAKRRAERAQRSGAGRAAASAARRRVSQRATIARASRRSASRWRGRPARRARQYPSDARQSSSGGGASRSLSRASSQSVDAVRCIGSKA